MLDMGFEPDIRKITAMCPLTGAPAEGGRTKRQTLFFTATWPKKVQAAAAEEEAAKLAKKKAGKEAAKLSKKEAMEEAAAKLAKKEAADRAAAQERGGTARTNRRNALRQRKNRGWGRHRDNNDDDDEAWDYDYEDAQLAHARLSAP